MLPPELRSAKRERAQLPGDRPARAAASRSQQARAELETIVDSAWRSDYPDTNKDFSAAGRHASTTASPARRSG